MTVTVDMGTVEYSGAENISCVDIEYEVEVNDGEYKRKVEASVSGEKYPYVCSLIQDSCASRLADSKTVRHRINRGRIWKWLFGEAPSCQEHKDSVIDVMKQRIDKASDLRGKRWDIAKRHCNE